MQFLNKALEGVYSEQSGWTVPDARLKAAVRRVVLQVCVCERERVCVCVCLREGVWAKLGAT